MPGPRLPWIVSLVALLLGLGSGYWIAHARFTPPPGRPARTEAPAGESAAAVRAALTDEDRVRGAGALAAILQRSGPESLEEIRAAFDSIFLDTSEIEVALLAEWWAAFDPEGAFAWSQRARVGYQALVIHPILRVWARRDPEAARAALFSIADPVTRRSCIDALVSGWDESGDPGLLEFLRGMPAGVEALISLNPIARRRVLRDGPESAFRWAESLPDDEPGNLIQFKLQVFRRVASAAAWANAPVAAAWAAQHADGPYGNGLLGRVGTGWCTHDGPAAMAWLSSLPPGKPRDDGVEDTFRSWLRWNREAALAWIENAPRERWLDPAMVTYAILSGRKDSAQGMALANGIHDEAWREKAQIAVARRWLRDAPDAAKAWLDASDLRPEAREEILSPPRNPAARRARREDDHALDLRGDPDARAAQHDTP